MPMPSPRLRRRSRILAMQALCQWDVQQDQCATELRAFLSEEEESAEVIEYASDVVQVYWDDSERIDHFIAEAAEQWEFSRISPVDRNTMRVAVVEMLGTDVPPKVAINEAIEIIREYGGKKSPGFVNGVLDKVFGEIRGNMEDKK